MGAYILGTYNSGLQISELFRYALDLAYSETLKWPQERQRDGRSDKEAIRDIKPAS